MIDVITPRWAVPPHVKAFTTTRMGGVSLPPFDTLNMGDHVEDSLEAVKKNRAIVHEQYHFPSEPVWLQQAHTTTVVSADKPFDVPPLADASVARKPARVCVALTADCLPVLVSNTEGSEVAAVHAGWRGLADGIVLETFKACESPTSDLHIWLGPAIGPNAFEVGEEVRALFLSQETATAEHFKPHAEGKYLADLYAIARFQCERAGVAAISGGEHCTYHDATRFYSYRRDGHTGRMGSFIWLEK